MEDKGMQFFAGPSSSDIKYHEIRVNDFASDKTSKIRIHIRGLDSIGVGIYIVNKSNCQQGFQSLPTHNIHGRVYDFNESIYKKYCSLPNSGTITITRYDNGILSGTFSCRAANEDDPNDIVEITDGRFDLDLSRLQYEDFP
ncbi:MAG: hypothetical protein CL605_03320 [Altibacter sp.]|nr:hypothetical protein [Altibacter sp.]